MIKYCGVDYYPEQWGLELLDEDLEKMEELGVNLIRLADFAWDKFEPKEGEYSFEFFDEVIKRIKTRNMKVLMCIPTATMPSWLYTKYPEIMNVDESGYHQPFGGRRGYCVNSDIYLSKACALTKNIVKHYKDEDAIVAYQVDNEIGHESSDMCFCDNCYHKFIEYLKNKYSSIDELNKRWGTSFWTNTYSDFNQIPLPRRAFTAHNPSLRLEWERFRSLSNENYIKALVDVIKSIDQNKPVTHDFEGGTINKHFNPFAVASHLDFVSYNHYPVWGGQKQVMSESEIAFALEFVRGFKHQNIWITEAIMGAQGHNDIGRCPYPNEAKKWSLDSLKYGVEVISFFRFRSFIKGAEQFCYGIIDADNEKRRKFYETKSFFEEAKKIDIKQEEAKACIIYDYDSKSSMLIQRQSNAFDYERECQKYFNLFFKRNIKCDILNSCDDFSKYKYVVIPYMIIMKDEFKKELKNYVDNGGKVILTPRTSWKDEDNNLIFGKRLPVDINDITGCVIEESEALLIGQNSKCSYNDNIYNGFVFEELLKLTSGKAIVNWYQNPFGDYVAAVQNKYGLGECYYLGSSFEDNLLDKIFDDYFLK